MKEKKKRISEDKIQVAVVLSGETIKMIDKLKSLIGKDLTMDELLQFMAIETTKVVEKEKFKQVDKPRKSLPPAKVGRVIPAQIKREVYKRDKNCTNCGSTHRLNFDHRLPYALGGPNSTSNIRLLCFQCNQRAGIRAGLDKKRALKGPLVGDIVKRIVLPNLSGRSLPHHRCIFVSPCT